MPAARLRRYAGREPSQAARCATSSSGARPITGSSSPRQPREFARRRREHEQTREVSMSYDFSGPGERDLTVRVNSGCNRVALERAYRDSKIRPPSHQGKRTLLAAGTTHLVTVEP
jgi:hypothetical protein